MPYARRSDRLQAKRRYNASPKGRDTRRRYYLATKAPLPIDPAPLAHVLRSWTQ